MIKEGDRVSYRGEAGTVLRAFKHSKTAEFKPDTRIGVKSIVVDIAKLKEVRDVKHLHQL